ncbi:sulfite exporter TauE/SafE family protein [Nocardioides sp. GCM10027113]|uniref:sulfite exporter TauE/SafE family protein n=1 Tax=unclassified Nocardioides TaxID=2615069 RepID=UPI0036138370
MAVLVGAFVQAVVGLGVGLVTAPLVAILEPSLMPALPLWFGLLVSGLSLAGERQHVDWRAIAWTLPARVPGTALGTWLVLVFTAQQLGMAVAVMVLVAVGLSLRAVDIPVTRVSLLSAGFTAGVTGTATSIGGPPIALLLQHRRPSEVRSTLAVFFFIGVVMSLVGLAVTDALPLASLVVAAIVSPGLLLGIWLGTRLRDRLPREQFRQGVLLVCAASAVALLAKSVS